MGEDDQSKGEGTQSVVHLVQYAGKRVPRDWVQAIPNLPTLDVLQETSIMLGCITALTRQALQKPSEAKHLMRATYYLSGMAKAMIQGQLTPAQKEHEG